MRKTLLMILISAAVFAGCGTQGGETAMQVKITDRDGWIYTEWNKAEEGSAYEVSLFEKDAASPFAVKKTEGTTLGLGDILAWYYQDTLHSDSSAHPMDLVVKVKAVKNGKTTARGESEPLPLSEFFPPEKAPQIGSDIRKEDITSFEWNSSGSSVDLIYNYSVSFDPEDPVYYASFFGEDGHYDGEKQCSEPFRNALLDVIGQGEMIRRYVMDPDIEILDGSEESFAIQWKNMKPSEKNYYRMRFNEQQKKELLALLRKELED